MDAALSGLADEELEFLELLLAERRWRTAEHRAESSRHSDSISAKAARRGSAS